MARHERSRDRPRDDLLGNAMRSNQFDYDYQRRQARQADRPLGVGHDPDDDQRLRQFGMVEIVFPAAILQPPFFDPNADPAVNYGGIGAVIGHEMSHHFDDQGAKYDKTRQSHRLVDAGRTSRASRRASTSSSSSMMPTSRCPGMHVNGKLTLGENVADLAGLTVAYDAYIASLGGKAPPVIDGITGDQRFYLGWAQVWRRNYREANLRQRLLTDPHSPSEQRARHRPQHRPLVPGVRRPARAEALPRAGGARAHLVGCGIAGRMLPECCTRSCLGSNSTPPRRLGTLACAGVDRCGVRPSRVALLAAARRPVCSSPRRRVGGGARGRQRSPMRSAPQPAPPDEPLVVGSGLFAGRLGARAESRADGADHQRRVVADRQRRLSRALRRHASAASSSRADDEARQGLELARPWRGAMAPGASPGSRPSAGTIPVEVERVGAHGEHSAVALPPGAAARSADERGQARVRAWAASGSARPA